jgi:sulfate permease, SulP family
VGTDPSASGASQPISAKPRGVRRYAPILDWLPRYDRRWLVSDAVAGLSVWALLVPQALAYATIAGVPVQYGLYTAFVALIAYAIFGTSRHLIQGPSAAVAAVSAAVVAPIVGASAMNTSAAVGKRLVIGEASLFVSGLAVAVSRPTASEYLATADPIQSGTAPSRVGSDRYFGRAMQRKPMCPAEVSIVSLCRAAGR